MNNTHLTPQPTQRIWIGHWLMAVAALHTLFALVFLLKPLQDIVRRGVFNTVGQDPLTAAAVWFLLFAAPLAMQALAITSLERSGQHAALRRQGWGLLAMSMVGVILMPESGFWLAIPAGIALLLRRPIVRTIDSI
ncbi:DUF6463 family protein [Roseateles oligotrophus]|uniref:DUF6463 family protein n=1 Tax=Roseateles oligotrophus TaxID=1769250 RepID=A0ABT2YKQ5_9BURK|nr:DUF6463 family protein [Roseateles oligotrophus]MCV2370626.1 DUF6463 family protein [Roseateles oligotrophus]